MPGFPPGMEIPVAVLAGFLAGSKNPRGKNLDRILVAISTRFVGWKILARFLSWSKISDRQNLGRTLVKISRRILGVNGIPSDQNLSGIAGIPGAKQISRGQNLSSVPRLMNLTKIENKMISSTSPPEIHSILGRFVSHCLCFVLVL